MKNLNIDLEAFLMEHWCHGVLSFDLKIGGIPQSHQTNVLNVKFFREIFDTSSSKAKTMMHSDEAMNLQLKSPQLLKKTWK